MRQPGVEVRGITQPDGTAEFCEVFFTDARCPKDNVVGGVNNGWKVANSTLAFERGMSATTGYRRFEEEYRLMVEAATNNGAICDHLVRQRLMQYYTKIQILKYNGLRSLGANLADKKDFGVMERNAQECDGACARHLWNARDVDQHRAVVGHMAGGPSGEASRGLPGKRNDVVVLLLPIGNHLGWHEPDSTQHRG
jgi:alkylation response protein AidB-like acyl-CoA dehydrogenase